jgi:choline dehydrogenase-like flavoprotein
MATSSQAQSTDFTRDVLGRYVCNGFDEAVASTKNGANPFHYIVIGGGMFGGALASFLAGLDPASPATADPFKRYHSRVLVLEAGPMLLSEHEQNLPNLGVGVPGEPTTIAQLQPDPRTRRQAAAPRNEVWGLPWHSDDGFLGLAYCLGGRSLFWGGWAPRFLRSEMPTNGASVAKWPRGVVDDLHANGEELWNEAAHQIGADDPNDFINGELHVALREVYFRALQKNGGAGSIRAMIPLGELPDYLDKDKIAALPPGTIPPNPESLRIDAPYAVQTSTRSGFFPFNKFSSVPLLIAAARQATYDSTGSSDQELNNSRRQVMIVPNCHIQRLRTLSVGGDREDLKRVVEVETNRGVLKVAHNAVVVLAMGAIESARLALASFSGARSYSEVGKNLMVHLRTNTQFRVKRDRAEFTGLKWRNLEVSAVQLRGRIDHTDGTQGHFHLQVVASGVPKGKESADAEIFRKIPDIDQFDLFRNSEDDEVAIAIRGIGEFSAKNPGSRVDLDPELDEFGVPRAFVRINDDAQREVPAIRNLNPKDAAVLEAMVGATNDVLELFGETRRPVRSEPPENPAEPIDELHHHIKLDGVGTTYHESGTLRMGEDPDDSVVNPDFRFHGVTNAYATDMSVLPTCGSANPVQPGIALTRRLARHLATPALDTVPPEGMFLFKDTPTPFWRLAGAPATSVDFGFGELEVTSAGGPFGVYWCMIPTPADFELSLDWMSSEPSDNSGIFIRFPDPDRPPPGRQGENEDKALQEPGAIASEYGFEIQIDSDEGGSSPTTIDGQVAENVAPRFRGTGAIYNESRQDLRVIPALSPGQWHSFIIRARGMSFEVDVRINGGEAQRRTSFTYSPNNYSPDDVRRNVHRGLPTRPGRDSDAKRYIGIQTHFKSKLIKYRNIFIRPL